MSRNSIFNFYLIIVLGNVAYVRCKQELLKPTFIFCYESLVPLHCTGRFGVFLS